VLRRFLSLVALIALPAAAAASACSAAGNGGSSSGFGGSGGGSGALTGSGGGGLDTGSGGSTGALMLDGGTGGGGNHDCAIETTLVYVVSQENSLYSFDPSTLTFTLVGPLDCPANGFQPFSMAVDRQGYAWVLYTGGRIWKVDIKTAHCTATAYQPNQHGFQQFGMGFSSNSANSTDETLYLANYGGSGIAALDTTSLVVTPVGQYDQIHSAAELTGTGDARLFGFFETTPINIAEIDKTNSHILSQHPEPNISIGAAWAFAFWGGSFWLFTNPNSTGSQVDQYDPMTGNTNTVVPDVGGFSIVGAGVSTCAPIKPPH
jgi:hypothetical protein